MFTLFDVFLLVGLIGGIACGISLGAKWMGLPGAIGVGILGGVLGAFLGQLPKFMTLRLLVRWLRRMSSQELKAFLRSPDCLTHNVVLLELLSRGESIAPELPVVLELLTSDRPDRRGCGWAALASAYPEVAEKFDALRADESPENRQRLKQVIQDVLNTHQGANGEDKN